MSWDVLLLRLPDEATSVEQITDAHTPAPVGSLHDVHAAINRATPDVDLSDPTRGELLGPTWSMELSIGSQDPVGSIMLHIRGSGDDALTPVFRLASSLCCKILDCSAGDLITPLEASGWHGFQKYRDHAVPPQH
ncbi:hypothetical protein ABT354_30560 [Streptomyces sp. NPDC000594]|uniref:hypothetical protein n=1 Tax=Streptomyces sp. NPDC000594 TaxID=3154261 RepID=UPI00332E0F05